MSSEIYQEVMNFINKIKEDKFHRYKSWEHCYKYFLQDKIVEDTAALHLSFYLASWGMYRGSSFLLWKDYKINKAIVYEILKKKNLQQIDFLTNSEENSKNIFDLYNRIKNWYKENIKIVKGEKKDVKASDTLVTKILLGTLGCTPAFDRYFIKGAKSKLKITSSFNESNFSTIIKFYKTNKEEFSKLQNEIPTETGVKYPVMKLIDMYFWEIGYKAEK